MRPQKGIKYRIRMNSPPFKKGEVVRLVEEISPVSGKDVPGDYFTFWFFSESEKTKKKVETFLDYRSVKFEDLLEEIGPLR